MSVQYQAPYISSATALNAQAGPSSMAASPQRPYQHMLPQQHQANHLAYQQARPPQQIAQPVHYSLGYSYPQPITAQIPSQNHLPTPHMAPRHISPVRPPASAQPAQPSQPAQPRHPSQTPTLTSRPPPQVPNGTARNGSTNSSAPSGSRAPSPANDNDQQQAEASGSQSTEKSVDAAGQSGPNGMTPAPPTFPYFGQHPSLPTLLAPHHATTFLPPGAGVPYYPEAGMGIGYDQGGYFGQSDDWLDHEGKNSHPSHSFVPTPDTQPSTQDTMSSIYSYPLSISGSQGATTLMEYLVLSPLPTALPTARHAIPRTALPQTGIPPSAILPLYPNLSPAGFLNPFYSPLYQPGAATEAMHHFAASFENMTGGTSEEWSEFAEEQFEEESRFLISLVSRTTPGLRLFDIPSISLPQIFTAFNPHLQSSSWHLRNHSESPLWSPPQSPSTDLPPNAFPRHGVKLESEGEWRMTYRSRGIETEEVIFKVFVISTWVAAMEEGVLKLETLEINVEDWIGDRGIVGEWGLPDRVIRYLEISESMEDVMGVFDLHDQGLSPKNALAAMTLPPPAKVQSSPRPVTTETNAIQASRDSPKAVDQTSKETEDDAMDQSSS